MPADRAELPRRHARRGRQPAAVDRDLRSPTARRSSRPDRRGDRAAGRRARRARGRRRRRARRVAGAGAPSERRALLEVGLDGGPQQRAARRRAQPPGRDRRPRAHARPRRHQHLRHVARAVAGQPQRRRSPCGSRREPTRRAAPRGRSIAELGPTVAVSVSTVRFDPVRPPARARSRRPPDKSISHRAALLGAMAVEPVRIARLPRTPPTRTRRSPPSARSARWSTRQRDEVVDPRRRACARRAALDGADRRRQRRHAHAAAARLAGRRRRAARFTLDGDASIRRRPVDRIAEPLRAMGARIDAHRRPLPAVHRPRRAPARHRLRRCRSPARR